MANRKLLAKMSPALAGELAVTLTLTLVLTLAPTLAGEVAVTLTLVLTLTLALTLAGEVAVQTSEKYIKRIWYLKNVDSGFMAQLAMRLEPMVFAPSELVPVGKMYICHRGIALYGGKIMTAGR